MRRILFFLAVFSGPEGLGGTGERSRTQLRGKTEHIFSRKKLLASGQLTGLRRPFLSAEGLSRTPQVSEGPSGPQTGASDAARARNVEGGPGALSVNQRGCGRDELLRV